MLDVLSYLMSLWIAQVLYYKLKLLLKTFVVLNVEMFGIALFILVIFNRSAIVIGSVTNY